MERLRNPAIWVLAVASVLPLWAATRVDCTQLDDDALITLTYAKNLALGRGFVFNHPPAVLGTTTPLYALLVAVLSRAIPFAEPTVTAVAVSAVCWVGVVWALYGFRRRLGLSDWQAVAAGLVVVATGWVRHLEMEAYLFALLLVVAVGLYMGGRTLWSGLAAGLLFLVRGEGALLFGILLVIALVRDLGVGRRPGGERGRSRAAAVAVGFGVPVLLWSAYAVATFGGVLPNTLAAKVAQGASGLWRPFAEQLVRDWLPGWGRPLWIADTPAFNLGYVMALAGLVVAARSARPLLVLVGWTASYVAGYAVLGVPGYPWYRLPVFFVLSLLLGVGLGALAEAVARRHPRPLVGAAVAAALVAVVVARLAVPTVRDALASESSPRKQAYLRLAEWLRSNTDHEDSVAYHEIGYLGYYTDNRIVDLVGLVQPDITDHVAAGDFGWGFWQHRPDYFVHLEGSGFLAAVVGDPRFVSGYVPVARLAGYDGRALTVYRRTDGAAGG